MFWTFADSRLMVLNRPPDWHFVFLNKLRKYIVIPTNYVNESEIPHIIIWHKNISADTHHRWHKSPLTQIIFTIIPILEYESKPGHISLTYTHISPTSEFVCRFSFIFPPWRAHIRPPHNHTTQYRFRTPITADTNPRWHILFLQS